MNPLRPRSRSLARTLALAFALSFPGAAARAADAAPARPPVATDLEGGALPAAPGSNPIFRDNFTADPAPLVVGDTVYVYVGRDHARGEEMFTMPAWLCYSSKDLKHWTAHGEVLRPTDFSWGEANSAWASQVVRQGDKFYFYVTARGDASCPGNNIGVAVADSPTGPFKDAIGRPLITNATTPDGRRPWEDIDPTVLIDDDGTAWPGATATATSPSSRPTWSSSTAPSKTSPRRTSWRAPGSTNAARSTTSSMPR